MQLAIHRPVNVRPVAFHSTESRTGRIGRVAFGAMFVLGAAAHALLVLLSPTAYRSFADGASLPFIKHAWRSILVPNVSVLIPVLAIFELIVGLSILAGGHWTRWGLAAAIAFHLGLMLFGWGFWVWSIPMLALLTLELRAERSGSVA
jgi:hypothetical protein